ncbi:NAD-dependent epimerase/dehydratase family protein [Lachnoclostridium sp. MSJ-17]|uniref:NAD-dependent epimerase/dehydratase family protein n=1 Tax=Lachnoclostridium sp. MSJ-17 TaxID=2841516 RepID=UPI001C108F46|nr:NAD-dependent epimerase/dehydratase family protein [Lachnoclostridium sp. MSJ-17]MBU5462330.1 NAD-dependent epimerase/dehydratase family protein [Lachnoclostridium sp. MSJ-17]
MRKILVTGGTNFVSRFTAEYFVKNGDEVYVLNRGSRKQVDGVTLIQADRFDLTDELRHLHFDAVLDICAYTGEHVNALLDALGEFDDYILISSSAVYPETNPQPFTEEQELGANSIWGEYGTNKIAAERALRRRVPEAYILRPPYLYGKYETVYRAPFVFDCALEDRRFFIPESDRWLQFFNVRDLCRFMDILLNDHPENRVFNVGNPEMTSVKDWAALCYKAAGKEPVLVRVDDSFTVRDYFPFHPYHYYLDVTKQQELMPELTPLDEGIQEEFDWYNEEKPEINHRDYLGFIDREFAADAE